jgi:hypothetical protein
MGVFFGHVIALVWLDLKDSYSSSNNENKNSRSGYRNCVSPYCWAGGHNHSIDGNGLSHQRHLHRCVLTRISRERYICLLYRFLLGAL